MASYLPPVIGLVTSGVGYNVIRKLLFQLPGVGLHGEQHTFTKPLWTSLISAIACTCCFLLYFFELWRHKHSAPQPLKDNTQPLLHTDQHPPQSPSNLRRQSAPAAIDTTPTQKVPFHECMSKEAYRKGHYGYSAGHLLRLSAPAITGNVSLILQGIGLRYISASISLVISSSSVVFTALLAIVCLKRRLMWLHWLGITLAVLGIGVTALVDPVTRHFDHKSHSMHGDAQQWPGPHVQANTPHAQQGMPARWSAPSGEVSGGLVLLGILLTLLSQFVGALQMVLEEWLLGGSYKLHPLQLLGCEGVIGVVFMAGIAMPIAHFTPGDDVDGRYENSQDTLVMLRQNASIRDLNAALLLCSLVTNWTGCVVTARLGSVFRSVLMTVRTGLVWAIDLAIYYAGIGHGLLGERWASGSPLELVGLVMSVAGVVLYAQGNSRVARAHAMVKEASLQPHHQHAWRIVRDVFLPQHRHLPLDHPSQAAAAALAHNQTFPSGVDLRARVKCRVSFLRTLFARSSWLLAAHEVDPALNVGMSSFRELYPRLPHALAVPETVADDDNEALLPTEEVPLDA